MQCLKRIYNCRGAYTVEAAILVPALFFVMLLLIYGFMFLYQKAVLVKTASAAVQQGAEIWTDSRKDIFTGKWNGGESKDSLYYRLLDDSLLIGKWYEESPEAFSEKLEEEYEKACNVDRNRIQEKKLAEVRKAVYAGLYTGFLKPKNTLLRFEFQNVLVQRKLEVVLTQEIQVPFGRIRRFFTGKDTVTLEGKASAVIAEPAEYIRNIDLAVEYASRSGQAFDLDSKLGELLGKLRK